MAGGRATRTAGEEGGQGEGEKGVSDYHEHPEWSALVKAVCVAPDDDLPRLVAADWLEDHAGSVECTVCRGKGGWDEGGGRPDDPRIWVGCFDCEGEGRLPDGAAARAEFVRIQLELARGGGRCHEGGTEADACGQCREVHRLEERERLLIREWVDRWFEIPWPDVIDLSPGVVPWRVGQVSMIVRRGFVAGWRVHLATWYGLPCPECESALTIHLPCLLCSGEGRMGGRGPLAVAAYPIDRVELVDMIPVPADGGERWWDGVDPTMVVSGPTMPTRMFEAMWAGYPNARREDRTGRWVWFADRDAARNALSDICIAWARAQAVAPA
jgi:uncharacterized protein (TIGR02996 family)